MTGYEPDTLIGLIGLIVIGIVTLAGALISAWATLRSRKDVRDVREQVKNDHPSNLRDDIDALHRSVKSTQESVELLAESFATFRRHLGDQGRDISGLRDEIGSLRKEARSDRDALAELEARLIRFIKREHPGAEPL